MTTVKQDNPSQIITMNVDVISIAKTAEKIIFWASNTYSSYVCVSNVHMCMETFDDEKFCHIVNDADLVVPDGRPLVWAQKLLGEKQASQVRGSDLLLRVCQESEKKSIPIGLYGGTPKSLQNFITYLKKNFPKLDISFAESPPFKAITRTEDENYVRQIKSSGARIVFVGIGCPKQEKWMAAHKNRINCVMIGVGAAFDFFSGQKKHAPRWMQSAGLEWFFRLMSDPKRLWKRYLKQNPRFLYYFLKQLINNKN